VGKSQTVKRQSDPVDAVASQEWEADRANRLSMAALFWVWYLPLDLIRARGGLHDRKYVASLRPADLSRVTTRPR